MMTIRRLLAVFTCVPFTSLQIRAVWLFSRTEKGVGDSISE